MESTQVEPLPPRHAANFYATLSASDTVPHALLSRALRASGVVAGARNAMTGSSRGQRNLTFHLPCETPLPT